MKKTVLTIFLLSTASIALGTAIPKFPDFVKSDQLGSPMYFTLKQRTPTKEYIVYSHYKNEIGYMLEDYGKAYRILMMEPVSTVNDALRASPQPLGYYYPQGFGKDKKIWKPSRRGKTTKMPKKLIEAFKKYLKRTTQ